MRVVRISALALLVLLALAAALRGVQNARSAVNGGEAIAAFEKRLEPVRAVLPFQRGVIGYIGEWDVPGIGYAENDQHAEFLLAQYALAPLILQRGPAAEWNAAVLGPKAFEAFQAAHPGQYEVTDLGHGVYIFRLRGNQ